ncbi:MAG: hypothetical protein HY321_17610 [Armatimonadetes bacterium]|nr:hypothetical protein [Armatimonadota bacterium]
MSDIHFLRPVARWLSIVVLAGVLCPHVPARAAEAPAAAEGPSRGSVAVLDTTGNRVVLSAGEREGITRGTEFRIVREGQEVARVVIDEVFIATSRGRVVSGLPAARLRTNDRAELIGTPPPPRQRAGKFPWGILVGAGIVTLVVLGLTRDDDDGTGLSGQGAADVTIR